MQTGNHRVFDTFSALQKIHSDSPKLEKTSSCAHQKPVKYLPAFADLVHNIMQTSQSKTLLLGKKDLNKRVSPPQFAIKEINGLLK